MTKSMIAAMAIGIGVAMAAPAVASASLGVHYRPANGSITLRGVRSDITTPSGNPSKFNVLSGTWATQAVLAGATSPANDLYAGYIQLNATSLKGCASNPGQLEAFTVYDVGSSHVCTVQDGSVGNSGQETHKFAVHRDNMGASWWGLFYNGTEKVLLDASFNTADQVWAYGEIHGSCNSNTDIPGVYPSSASWARTDDVYGNGTTTWTTITADSTQADPGWSIGIAPSPFTISFTC